MDETVNVAAKEMAKGLFQSNVSAIVVTGAFLVFIGVVLWLVFRRQDRQDATIQKRENLLVEKFEKMLEESDRKWEQSASHSDRKWAETTERFGKIVQDVERRTDDRERQQMELLRQTIETMAVVKESSQQSERATLAAIARIEAELAKKQDKRSG